MMSPLRLLLFRATTVAVLAVGLAGCGSNPRAPALEDEAVYNNSREGFRFLVPEGWTQQAKAEVPSGKLDKGCSLVQYQRSTDPPAVLEASLADLAESTDLAEYLAEPSFGASQWRQISPAEDIQVNHIAAMRFVFTAKLARGETTKEVVVIRRSGRVYFFNGIFPAKDAEAREQIRRAVASLIWK